MTVSARTLNTAVEMKFKNTLVAIFISMLFAQIETSQEFFLNSGEPISGDNTENHGEGRFNNQSVLRIPEGNFIDMERMEALPPDQNVECQPGYKRRNNRCVKRRRKCPINFEWNGVECKGKIECPVNYILIDNECISNIPECLLGSAWNGERCVNNCPDGSSLDGNECVTNIINCPRGMVGSGNECIINDPNCPAGFILAPSGICSQVKYECPPGTFEQNGTCATILSLCPPGTLLSGNECITEHNICPPGTTKVGNVCVKPVANLALNPTNVETNICPDGFSYKNKKCYKCPSDYKICGERCIRNHRLCNQDQPLNPPENIHINIHIQDLLTPQIPAARSSPILNSVEPIINEIFNLNNITHPVTLHNLKVNNITITESVECPDGSVKTVVVKNNEIVNGCAQVDPTDSRSCCTIVGPRKCREKENDQWVCTHKQTKHCGKECKAKKVYLKPLSTFYENNILIVAPSKSTLLPCQGRNCHYYGRLRQLPLVKNY